jgi:tetratricopeptide (TPR) repeat protein
MEFTLGVSRDELRQWSSQIDGLFDLGKREEATTLLEQAISASAEDTAYNLFFLGEAAGYLEKDRKKQKNYLLQAYHLDENDPYIVKNLGVYYLINNYERKAINLFDKAIELDPNDFETFRNKGLALSNLGREKKAMEWFARAITMNPSDYDSIRQTGISHSKLGRDMEAIEWFKKALHVNENDYDSMRQMGISLAMLGKYETSVEVLNLALSVNPNDFESKRNRHLVLRKMTGEGETFFSRILNYFGRKLALAWKHLINLL